jgi:transposase
MENSNITTEYDANNELLSELMKQHATDMETISILKEQLAVDAETIRLLKEQISILALKRFAPSSEKMQFADGQQIFEGYLGDAFNEAEATAAPSIPEPVIDAEKKSRGKKEEGKRNRDFSGLTVEEIIIELPEDKRTCEVCSSELSVIGTKVVREELKYIPAQVSLVRYKANTYACPNNCELEDGTTPIIQPDHPASLITKSYASASLIAGIIDQKFTMGLPLYRQEQDFARKGLDFITRQNMANWIINVALNFFVLMYNLLHEQLLEQDIINADETELQVLNEPGRKATTKSYMWLYRTGAHSDKPVVLFEYQPTRNHEHPQKFLGDFHKYLATDGYQGYQKLEVTNVGCWDHCRRKYHDSYMAIPKNMRNGSPNEIGLNYCNQLSKLEQKFKPLSPEARYKARLTESKPLAEQFFEWADKSYALPKTLLGQALTYTKNQKEYLMNVFLDGRLELTNNLSERSIKPFVIGRKGWLFANTVTGAKASAISYSMIETAKANNLIPYEYLKYLLEKVPYATTKSIADFLPWSDNIPNECRMNKK